MKSTIEAIFFDVGGTLRTGLKYPEPLMDNIREIMELTGLDGTPQEWMERFNVRYRQYYHWGTLTLMEFSEAELWSQWLLPEVPAERIQPIAARLNQLWRDAKSNKYPLEDTTPTLKELARRGYHLGIIRVIVNRMTISGRGGGY
jgi:FMN phosphatase YigB (HAD superfamily)